MDGFFENRVVIWKEIFFLLSKKSCHFKELHIFVETEVISIRKLFLKKEGSLLSRDVQRLLFGRMSSL